MDLSKILLSFKLFFNSIQEFKSWSYLGYQEIILKYRRSILGPWWATSSIALMIIMLSYLWSKIFGLSLQDYVPYFAIGYMLWLFFSTCISESCTLLYENSNIIKQTKVPIIAFATKLLIKNLIIFLHNLILIIFILIFMCEVNFIDIVTSIFFFILFSLNIYFAVISISILSARYYDFSQIVINFIQLLFFVTPIIWEPEFLKDKIWVNNLNPLYHWINLIREPLINGEINFLNIQISVVSTLLLFLICLISLNYSYRKVSLWI